MFFSLKPFPATATLFLSLIAPTWLLPSLVAAVAQASETEPILNVQGTLEPGDSTQTGDNSLYDEHSFVGKKGQTVAIVLESLEFDTYLLLLDPQGEKIDENDDASEGNKNSLITLTLPEDGTYTVLTNAHDAQGRGRYALKVVPVLSGQEQQLFSDATNRQAEAHRLTQQGVRQFNISQFQEALKSFEQALAIYREIGDGSADLTVRKSEGKTLSNLGVVHDNLGQYPKAIEYYQQALAIKQEIGDLAGVGTTLNNLGVVYDNLGQYPQAIEYYQQALAIRTEVGDRAGVGTTLNNLGNVYNNLGQSPQAIEYYQQALAIHKEVGNRLMEGTTLNNLGEVYRNLGQYKEAIEYYQQALTILQEVGDLAGEGKILNNLGLVHRNLGQYKEAIEYYQQAFTILQEVGDLATEGKTLNNLGAVHHNLGQYAEAEQNLYAAITVWESLRSPELSDADKISIFETQAHTYRGLQQTLIAQNKTNAALEISERGRARAFVELLTRQLNPQSEKLPKVDPPSLAEIKQIAQDQNATLVQYSLLPNTALYIWVIQPTGQIDFRSVDLKELDGSLANLLNDSEISEAERIAVLGLRGATEPDRALTSLVRGTQESLRFPLRVAPAEDAVSSAQRLQNLHQLLIEPIADLLPTDPKDRVIFIPHQSLFYVPFVALQDAEFNYLIEKHTILTAPSIQVLNLTRQHRERIGNRELGVGSREALIVGNPTMPSIPDKNGDLFQLSNLSGAESEAVDIAQMLGAEALLGAKATETEVSKRMKTARLIHFATHGLLEGFGFGIPGAIALAPDSSVSPLASGSTLTFGNPSDGLLTSGEIVTLTQNNPLNAELVVLSACDTGLGDLSGDGVVGLSRSLIAAGVPSIVVSLWKVPDAQTKALMTEFYTNLYEREMDKAQALRQAMLTMIEREKSDPDPAAWAAFTLIGEAE